MQPSLLAPVGFALLAAAAAGCLMLLWFARRRLARAERELARLSDDLFQLAELQLVLVHKVDGELRDMEEKLLDLALPAADAPLPLERRHRVLALARKGMAPVEIAERLGMPAGEVELILGMKGLAETRVAPASGHAPPAGVREKRKDSLHAMLA